VAAGHGHLPMARLLVNFGAELETADERGHSPLMLASANGQAEMVGLLLDAGAQADARDALGFSPVMLAVQDGHADAARRLLEAGVALDYRVEGLSPSGVARANAHKPLARELRRAGSRATLRPMFGQWRLGFPMFFNFNDMSLGFEVKHQAHFYDAFWVWGFTNRPFRVRVFEETRPNVRFQYWETRLSPYTGFEKVILRKNDDMSVEVILGAMQYFSFADYRGTRENGGWDFHFSPRLGVSLGAGRVRMDLSYNYLAFEAEHISPHRVGIAFFFSSSEKDHKIRSSCHMPEF